VVVVVFKKMTKLIIFKEKNSNRHFAYETQDELNKIFLKIFKERIKEGSYYENSLRAYFKELIKKKDYFKIRWIMSERASYEYESYYLDTLEEI